jgi:hypothetical protein
LCGKCANVVAGASLEGIGAVREGAYKRACWADHHPIRGIRGNGGGGPRHRNCEARSGIEGNRAQLTQESQDGKLGSGRGQVMERDYAASAGRGLVKVGQQERLQRGRDGGAYECEFRPLGTAAILIEILVYLRNPQRGRCKGCPLRYIRGGNNGIGGRAGPVAVGHRDYGAVADCGCDLNHQRHGATRAGTLLGTVKTTWSNPMQHPDRP